MGDAPGYIRKPHMRANYNKASHKKQTYDADRRRELSGKTRHKLHTEYMETTESLSVTEQSVKEFREQHGHYPSECLVPWWPNASYKAVAIHDSEGKFIQLVGVTFKRYSGEFVELR